MKLNWLATQPVSGPPNIYQISGSFSQVKQLFLTKTFCLSFHFYAHLHLVVILGGKDHVSLPDNTSEEFLDVSLITGKIRNVDITNSENDTCNKSVVDRGDLSVCLSTGSEFLVNRTWQGLEQNLGQNPVEVAAQGRSGIASSYHSEPMQRGAK